MENEDDNYCIQCGHKGVYELWSDGNDLLLLKRLKAEKSGHVFYEFIVRDGNYKMQSAFIAKEEVIDFYNAIGDLIKKERLDVEINDKVA